MAVVRVTTTNYKNKHHYYTTKGLLLTAIQTGVIRGKPTEKGGEETFSATMLFEQHESSSNFSPQELTNAIETLLNTRVVPVNIWNRSLSAEEKRRVKNWRKMGDDLLTNVTRGLLP